MSNKITDLTESIQEFLKKQDFSDLEKKNVNQLINEISIYHEELYFQNKELERTKEQLEKYSEEIFDLFYNAPIAYVILDEKLNIVKSNIQFQNYIKYTNEELLGKKITDFISEISQDDFFLYFKSIENGKTHKPIIITLQANNTLRAKLQLSLHLINGKKQYRGTFTDLTEWYILQDLLKESKQYYEKIIENSPFAVHGYVLDNNDDLIFNIYNPTAEEILKIDHSPFIGIKIEEIFPNLKNSYIAGRYKEIARNGGILKVDNYNYEDDILFGIYSLVAYQPVKNQVIIFFRDTTEENFQKTLQEVEQSISNAIINKISLNELAEVVQKELNKIIDTSNFCIATYDEDSLEYSTVFDSNQYTDIKKWQSENSLSDIVRKLLRPTHFVREEIEKLINDKIIDQQVFIPESWLGIPLIDNNVFIGIIIIKSYSTKLHYNNEQINFLQAIANYISTFIQRRKSDQFVNILYRSIVNSPVSIVITDPNGNIEYINPKCEEITGFTLKEVKNKKTSLFKSGHHNEEFYKNLWDTILSGNTWEGKFLNRKKDGSLYWEEAKIAPVLDSNNNITNFVAIKEDVTPKEKLIEDLRIAKEKAEESDRLKSAFLANMSHEIRTPLNAILGFSSVLAEEEVSPEEKSQFNKIITEKGEELLKLIEDLLDLSKLEVNQIKITNTIISIQNLFDELYRTYSVILKNHSDKNIRIEFKILEPYDLNIVTDSIRIRQILDNLIQNAIKFTNEGSIKVTCELIDDYVLFSVSDTGIGIAKENYEIIFERFRQADDDFARRKFGGVGLGLPIVKKLVLLLGGEIWLQSELGKGTTFYFTLKYQSPDK